MTLKLYLTAVVVSFTAFILNAVWGIYKETAPNKLTFDLVMVNLAILVGGALVGIWVGK